VSEEKIGISPVKTSQIFIMSPVAECMRSCCDEQEAASIIAELVEEEGLDADDIYVVRGEEIALKVTKQKAATISFDGKKVL
jgi:hypothetical protein